MRRPSPLPGAALLMALSLALPARAAGPTPPEPGKPIVIGTEHTLRSKVLDEERRFFISLPPDYEDSTERYPVLYLLDGDPFFHHSTGTVRFLADIGRAPHMIIVGVPNTQRTRDLTPPAKGDTKVPGAGGADKFLRFLSEELAPTIEARYRTRPYRILVGHSYGGLFAVHALLNKPESFNAYVAVSPSLWWNDRELVRGAVKALEKLPARERWLYMTMGNEGQQMVPPIQELASALEKAKPARLAWRYAYLENDHHASTPHRSLLDGLEAIFAGWDVPPASVVESADARKLDAHYAALTERFGFEVRPTEDALNILGYDLLEKGKAAAALTVFRKNVALYGATSANVHDSLGDGLEAAGQKEDALASYLRAWKLATETKDPRTAVYKEHLDRALRQAKK